MTQGYERREQNRVYGEMRNAGQKHRDGDSREATIYARASSAEIRAKSTTQNGGCGCRIGFSNPISYISDGVNGALQWDGGITPPPGFRPPPLLDPTVGNFNAVDVFSDNFGRAPRIQTRSFSIQQEVGKFLIDVAYAGTRSTKLNSTGLLNQLPVERLSLGSLLQQRIDSPAVDTARPPARAWPTS